MNSPAAYATLLAVLALAAVAGTSRAVHKSRHESSELARARADHARLIDLAREADLRAERMKHEGGAAYTHQLAVAERQSLPQRLDRALSDAGVTVTARNHDHQRVEVSLSGSTPALLRALARCEHHLPELRLRSARWNSMPEGTSLTAQFDLWPIPSPAAR